MEKANDFFDAAVKAFADILQEKILLAKTAKCESDSSDSSSSSAADSDSDISVEASNLPVKPRISLRRHHLCRFDYYLVLVIASYYDWTTFSGIKGVLFRSRLHGGNQCPSPC